MSRNLSHFRKELGLLFQCSRDLSDHVDNNLDLSTFARKKIETGYAPCLYHVGFSRNEDSIKTERLVPDGFGTSRCRKAVYFSLVSPHDQNPDSKCKPSLHIKDHHDLTFLFYLEAAHNFLEFYNTRNGSVLSYDTVLAEFLTQIINIEDGAERLVKAQSNEREASPTKKSRRDGSTPRETSRHKSQDQEPLQTRPPGEILSTARSTFNALGVPSNSRLGAIFCSCGKKLGGPHELQERNDQMTIERGSQVSKALTQLRIVAQARSRIDMGHLMNNCTSQ